MINECNNHNANFTCMRTFFSLYALCRPFVFRCLTTCIIPMEKPIISVSHSHKYAKRFSNEHELTRFHRIYFLSLSPFIFHLSLFPRILRICIGNTSPSLFFSISFPPFFHHIKRVIAFMPQPLYPICIM